MTKLEEIMQKTIEFKATMAKAREAYQEAAKATFTEASAELFKMYPELKSFRWKQYTPYFADGDECIFNAATDRDSIFFNGVSIGYGNDEDLEEGTVNIAANASPNAWDKRTYKYSPNPDYNSHHGAIVDAVHGFLKNFDDDLLKDMFGDHISVKVTIDGTSTEEYEHD